MLLYYSLHNASSLKLVWEVEYLGILEFDELLELLNFQFENFYGFLQLLYCLVLLQYDFLVHSMVMCHLLVSMRDHMLLVMLLVFFVAYGCGKRLNLVFELSITSGGWAFSRHQQFLCLFLLVRGNVSLQDFKDSFNGVWDAVHSIFHVSLDEGKAKLFEDFLIQRIPVVGLLRNRMGRRIVMQLHYMRHEVLHNLSYQHYTNPLT